jgi:hypothetical protein
MVAWKRVLGMATLDDRLLVFCDFHEFVLRKTYFTHITQRKAMEPPQTKKQTIKNQKRKGLSEHRLGSAKHVRLAVATQQKRIPK